MDGFGDNFDDTEVDPAAEFLAREQDQLAGLEDELKPAVVPLTNESYSSPASHKQVQREEPEKIKKWREDQKKSLEEKDQNEEKKKLEWHESAKKELEEWYKHHDELIAKTKATNRNAEKQFVAETDAIEPGTEWERIAKLCDFNPKSSRTSKDVSRMRSIILQLKQAPPAAKQG
uniref:Clathrin light chain n=1 Tax=Clastoptera arizonana TaxID=38151 RepID=A0A1B6DED4_9HEMI